MTEKRLIPTILALLALSACGSPDGLKLADTGPAANGGGTGGGGGSGGGSGGSGSSNFDHIKTGLVAYAVDTYPSGFRPGVMSWIAHRFDHVIGSAVDPRTYNSRDTWTSYVDSAFVYAHEIYGTVKATAASRGYAAEDLLLHMNVDYQVSSALARTHQDQFDAFEMPAAYAGAGDFHAAVNGAFLYNGATYTDVTVTAYDGAHSTAIADRLLLGYGEPFDQVNFTVTTGSTRTVTWQYWNGSAWSALTPASDGSAGISVSGQVLFTPPADWAPTSIHGSRSKYWVQAAVSGAGTSPVVSKVFGDDWKAHTGSNNCRGWDAAAAGRVNVGLGNLEYNPAPPAGSTAHFRYQARATGIWAANANFGNVGNIQGGKRTWADVLVDSVLLQHTGPASPDGIMFDDGLSQPALVSAPGTIEAISDLGTGTWKDNGTAVYGAVVTGLHGLLGADFKVGVNTPYQQYAYLGDWALDELTINTTNNGEDPITVGSRGTGQTAGQTYDNYLTSNNAGGTSGMLTTWSAGNFGMTSSGGVWNAFDQSNRGPINALATYYIAANPHTYFLYNTYGWSYFETDEFYYWSTPTLTTATVAIDTSSAAKLIHATDVSAFANVALYGTIIVKLGGSGEVLHATKVDGTTLSTTDPIHLSYASGAPLSYAIMGHQSTDTPPALSNIWKWGPWFPAIGVDVGQPDPAGYNAGARKLNWITGPAASGNSAACGSACSEVWRRDYTKAVILSRVLHWNSIASEVNTYSVPIALGATYYPLMADGKTGAGISSIQLRGGDAAILMKSPVP